MDNPVRPSAETFSIMTEAPAPGSTQWRLTARGALTDLGGEIALAAVNSVLGVGARQLTMDLTRITLVEYAGLCWLRRACSQVAAAGGQLAITGAERSWDLILAPSPEPVPAGRSRQGVRR